MIEMYKVTLPLLLLLLPEGLSNWEENLYHSTKNLSWDEAKEHCRAKGADLITMKTEDDKRKYRNVDGWVDFRRDSASSVWTWYRTNIEENNPNFEGTLGEDCAYHNSGEKGLHSSSCDVERPFTCRKIWLFLVRENKTWEEALNHCRALVVKDPSQPIEHDRNFIFDLATFLTDTSTNFARHLAKRATTDEIWTGLRYLAGDWLWMGGEKVMYEDIEKCPSNGFCGTLPKAGDRFYGVRHCDEKRNFFCYRKESTGDGP